jgi:hypothetical protein
MTLICASGEYVWGSMLIVLIGNLIAIGAVMLINNWSDQRRYPSYWGALGGEYCAWNASHFNKKGCLENIIDYNIATA